MDYTRSAQEILVSLINAVNPDQNFTASQISFDPPTIPDAESPEDVRILSHAVYGSGFRGQRLLTLGRLNIQAAIPDGALVEFDEQLTLQEIVDELNTTFSLNLTAGLDYATGAVPEVEDPEVGVEVVIPILDGSYLYHGSISVLLQKSTISLEDAIENTDLGQLEYP